MADNINLIVDEFEDNKLDGVNSKDELVIDVGGFEGPIDVLLALARDQKVDLAQISILQLAEQYLLWVERIQSFNLELAADYLVVAAWLAYLKSRLLIPDLGTEDQPSANEMAEALQFQLRRLEGMQDAGNRIMSRKQLGKDFFQRGNPERFGYNSTSIYEVSMYDLLSAYAEHTHRSNIKTLHIQSSDLFSVDDVIRRFENMLGDIADWALLDQFLPIKVQGDTVGRSAVASTFAAALQMVKEGKIKIRQGAAFEPIFIKDSLPDKSSDLIPNQRSIPEEEKI